MAVATRRAPGFTLLELLAAMCLMVAIGSCLYTSLYTAFTSRRSALIAVEPDIAALNVLELVKQDLDGTLAPTGTLAGSFIGTDSRFGQDDTDSVEFYTTSVYGSDTILVGGIAKVELLLEDNEQEDNYRLVRRVTTNLLSPKDVEPTEQVLCRNVASLNFRFYDGNDWVDDWDSIEDANSLPLAVEVDIKIAYDDSRASGSASVLSRNDRINSVTTAKEYKLRRLVQAFAIPCGGEATTISTSDTSDTSGDTAGGAGGAGGGGG